MTSITTVTISQIDYNLDGSKSFGIFLSNILSLIKLMHWYTDNFQVHKILGKLYNNLENNFDSLQEEIIGVVKDQRSPFNVSTPIIDPNDAMLYKASSEEKLNEIYKTIDVIIDVLCSLEFKTFVDGSKCGINNTKETIVSFCNQSKYLLRLINIK